MAGTLGTETLGSGEYTFRPVVGWEVLPAGWQLGDVGGIAVDRNDRVYVFNRGPHPMMVFDLDGNFLESWGEDIFTHPHGVSIHPDGSILCTDDHDHSVRKMTPDGKVLMVIGTPGRPAERMSGAPFCRCTHTAVSPEGDIYVSDGYENARIHKYTANGELLFSWGSPGIDDGQFTLPHNIGCDLRGRLYVADRENHRIQVFDGGGRLIDQWHNIHRPNSLYVTPEDDPTCYIGEAPPYGGTAERWPGIGPRIGIYNHSGKLKGRLFTTPQMGVGPGQFLAPHGLGVDSRGDIYVGDVSSVVWSRLFPGVPQPDPLRTLQKLAKVS